MKPVRVAVPAYSLEETLVASMIFASFLPSYSLNHSGTSRGNPSVTPSPQKTALQTALSALLRVEAPNATLLAALGEEVMRVQANETSDFVGKELVPPDDWFDKGEMTWLTRDGTLLGLLWSEDGEIPQAAIQVLTMLLSAARADGANREAEMLVTQLPVAIAWLTSELTFRKVSRPFLELFDLNELNVTGSEASVVFHDRPELLAALHQSAAGRSIHLSDEMFNRSSGPLWVRGEAKPYFGGATAGVMLTLQDVTGEYLRSIRIASLMDTDTPLALLNETGMVIHASQGLLDLTPPTALTAIEAPLWSWPCFANVPSLTVKELVQLAASGGAARANVELANGNTLPLSVRRTSESGLLIAEGPSITRDGQAPLGMISQVLALSEDATILIDHLGRAQLVSDRAAQLLGVEASRLVGLGVARVLGELGVKAFTPEGEPLALLEWREVDLPLRREILLSLPNGAMKHMELRATAVGSENGAGRTGVILALRDLTALRRTQAKMRHDARHDSLTGLLNRTGMREALGSDKSTSANVNLEGTIVCVDIDGFGALNAALGRTACDRILIQIAARLNDVVLERSGFAARLADDSFVVTLFNSSKDVTLQLVSAALNESMRAGRRDVPITCAIGVVSFGKVVKAEQALADAEIAMQHAKRQGRAQISFFDATMRDQVARAFELEEALRDAIEGQQLTLLYQPAISLESGVPLSAEALLRWNHPTLGMLTPNHFLPLASRSDLITHISEWVVQNALAGRKVIRNNLPEKYPNWQVSVNLGLEELRRSTGLQHLLPLLKTEGAPDIEVTAGSLIDHSQETLGLLEQLRTLGARLTVDDFGDGASSLATLTRFPLSAVKLHPTLTSRLPNDKKSITLVEGTVNLAHSLGLQVVAVGVESEDQLQILRQLGCDAAQGYAISPPVSAEHLVNWLKER